LTIYRTPIIMVTCQRLSMLNRCTFHYVLMSLMKILTCPNEGNQPENNSTNSKVLIRDSIHRARLTDKLSLSAFVCVCVSLFLSVSLCLSFSICRSRSLQSNQRRHSRTLMPLTLFCVISSTSPASADEAVRHWSAPSPETLVPRNQQCIGHANAQTDWSYN